VSETQQHRAVDPAELWRQWFETGTRVWTDALAGAQEGYADPYGLYRQWFEGMYDSGNWTFAGAASGNTAGNAIGPVGVGSGGSAVPAGQGQQVSDQVEAARRLWQQWSEATTKQWQQAAGTAAGAVELTPLWIETLEKARRNFVEAEGFPTDPLQFATRWYNATSGPLSDFVGELIEREDLLGASSQAFSSYASFYRVFRRNQEEYLGALRLPTRTDIERVAGLVVNLEDKLDRLEEALEESADGRSQGAPVSSAGPGMEERVGAIEGRLAGLEGKVDRILAALENAPRNGGREQRSVSREETEASSSSNGMVSATDAARRKARELKVNLDEVTGTGTNGQITVEDVRRKGEEG
jgi:hypothetical protein